MSTEPYDLYANDVVSGCCGAKVYENHDICTDCGEHCSSEPEDNEEMPGFDGTRAALEEISINRTFSPKQERIIARHEKICELAKCEGPDHGDHLQAQDDLINLEKNGN